MTLTQINKAGLDEIALDHVFTIGANGVSAYTFQGEGLNGTVNNPTLYLTRGKTYRFENGTGAHAIRIQSADDGTSGTLYNTGVTNNNTTGTVIVEVQHDAPDVLYYQCANHANMKGILYITGALADGGVTTAKIADDAVTDAKLANSINASIAANTAKTSNATHTGDVTGSTSLTIASGAVTEAKLATNAVTTAKIANNAINSDKIATNAVNTTEIADTAVTLAKLEHGTSSNNGKFLRANNGADPTFETVNTDLVSDTSPQLGGNLESNGNDILMGDNDEIKLGAGGDLKLEHQSSSGNSLITEVGGGDLIIQGSDIIIRDAGTAEKHIEMTQNGSVDLYHNGSKKVETSSTGIDINTGGSDLGSSIKIYGHDTIKRNYWGYGTTYKGIQIGRSDSNVNSSIFIGVDPSGNTSGAFGGYGQEIIFRNDLSFYHPNNANNNWHSFMRTGRFGDTGAANFPNGLGFGSDTATANVINDYEIGTYAPALGGNGNISGGNGMGLTYTTQAGYYIKIGDFVFCNGILVWTAKSGTLSNSSGVYCTLSIPFAQNNNNNQGAGQLSYNNGLDFNADCNSVHGVGSNSYIYFNRVAQGSGGHAGYVMTSNVSGSGQINFAYSYRIL